MTTKQQLLMIVVLTQQLCMLVDLDLDIGIKFGEKKVGYMCPKMLEDVQLF